jgi:hypothetical protein
MSEHIALYFFAAIPCPLSQALGVLRASHALDDPLPEDDLADAQIAADFANIGLADLERAHDHYHGGGDGGERSPASIEQAAFWLERVSDAASRGLTILADQARVCNEDH